MSGRAGLAAAIGLLAASCGSSPTPRPVTLFGLPAPPGCHGKHADADECKRWAVDAMTAGFELPPYDDAAVAAYVTAVGTKLVRAAGNPRDWQFRVIDDPSVQARAGAGTMIFVNRGILGVLRDEAELAAVIAHELGHALAGHSSEMIAALGHDIPGTWGTHTDARDDEIQADELSVILTAHAGYDATAASSMMRALAAGDEDERAAIAAREAAAHTTLDVTPPPAAPATPAEAEAAAVVSAVREAMAATADPHPAWPERIARVEALAAHYPGGTRDPEAYARGMATLAIGDDPTSASLIGRAVVFARAGYAVDVLDANQTAIAVDRESRDVTIELGPREVIDVRLLPADLAAVLPAKPNLDASNAKDPSFAMPESAIASHADGDIAVVVTVAGPHATARAQRYAAHVRAPTAAERAAVTATRFDPAAPRRLWTPTRPPAPGA